MIFAS